MSFLHRGLIVFAILSCLPTFLAAGVIESQRILDQRDIFVGEIAIRSTSSGYVIALQDDNGETRNFFFHTATPPYDMVAHEPAGVLYSSRSELHLLLPSEGTFLRLAVAPTTATSADPWTEQTRRRLMLTHRIPDLWEVRDGIELIAYGPALEGLEVAALWNSTDRDFLARLGQAGAPGIQTDFDALFHDSDDNPGDSSCKVSCSAECLGGASCSANCPNRCAECVCNKDLPSCSCTNM
jgi:hypothetical protein